MAAEKVSAGLMFCVVISDMECWTSLSSVITCMRTSVFHKQLSVCNAVTGHSSINYLDIPEQKIQSQKLEKF